LTFRKKVNYQQFNMTSRKVEFIQFGVMSPEEIRKYAVCEITSTKIRNPESGNLYDPRMGPTDNHTLCVTCGLNNIECPGHFGYIELEKKVVHPKFSTAVLYILKSICNTCSSCLIQMEHLRLNNMIDYEGDDRVKILSEEFKKVKSCPESDCGKPTVNWEYKDGFFSYYYDNKNDKIDVTVDDVYDILRKVSDETMYILGFNRNLADNDLYKNPDTFVSSEMKHRHQTRPEWFIFTVLPVLPPCIRPCISPTPDEKQDDDLTDKYVSICKANDKLRKHRLSSMEFVFQDSKNKKKSDNLAEADLLKVERDLMEAIRTMFDNSDESSVLTTGRPHKCIKSRMNNKDGHIRKNVQAKRCDFSGRTVIDAGPNLKFYQVSIPQAMAEKGTKPQMVTQSNLVHLNKLLDEGKVNYVLRDGRNIRVDREKRYARRKIMLRVGDIVERHLQTGDWVIMNRQPTLRVESMNGHQVVISPDPNEKVIRFNLSACNGYNADFDGDLEFGLQQGN